ncbi:hypothetical protein F441_03502 [Phytophthora nicotianae CJ01A1]|uniref:Condensation domain-containing protein n=4 Tax=Phytophthora nicotianae TaxID=4792 RepID=W2QKB2_PHYN3|nr:hypothetical protein PPTG_08366 [Phytophthora nicotianae INRA-310]ETK93438.1 hypothetical protein L915_03375 [Phytophthora nicotianae]ETO82248.1 hypothetical protein F444_03577 [Phytophthora nicotianae P1976]ETP23364.1 hypothetical protein F441_03502 [Phytophthora nicotianae CJ01A1]KUF76398.1 hypothetical protein AM587_10014395 [Phytophthora nicotianae]ETL46839.1 hypothetical protein L916_03346 [Phytophthora nicotianae]
MSIEVETSAAGSRIYLRGVERMVTASDRVSVKIAHSMLVRGDTTILLHFLPFAVIHAFNVHPRMRALQLKDQQFTAEIQAPVTTDTIAKILQVRVLTPADYGDGSPTSWQSFVEKECSVGFDRYYQLPFFLSVWVAKRKDTARLMLFSDQYMSDGFSGAVVLNCILDQVSKLARQASSNNQRPSTLTVKEYPLRPSLYRMWLNKITWAKPLLKGTNVIFGRRMFRGNVHKFTPLLPARDDQKDFAVPPVTNSTKALFADGDAKCMREALSKCRKEGVTLNGVLIVAVLLAFYRVRSNKEQRGRFNPFRIAMDVDCNMRQQVQHPAEENQVGMYTATTDLDWLNSEGVDMLTTRFWDLAGRASREIEANLKNTMNMALPTITADQKLNAQMDPSFLKKVRVAHSITADVGIAELVQYPFEKNHSLTDTFDTESRRGLLAYKKSRQVRYSNSESDLTRSWRLESMHSTPHNVLSIESLHVFKALPHLAPSVTIFLSSVNAFSYSMAHKVKNDVGNNLFTALVVLCESLGSIGGDENLTDVLARLDE